MSDLKKALKIVIPLIITFYFGPKAGLLAYGLMNRKKNRPRGSGATYGLAALRNTLSNRLAVPIVYGTVRVGGNIIWQKNNTAQSADRAIVFCQGPVESVSKALVLAGEKSRPLTDFPGCSINLYTGTAVQTPDATRMAGNYKGSVKNLAYGALSFTQSEQLPYDPVVTVEVKGKKIAVYNGSSWSTVWSENPAWIIYDFLVNECGYPAAKIDGEGTFYAISQICAQTIAGEYDTTLRNVALGATVTGGNNPTLACDGSLAANAGWWWTASADETLVYGGKIDMGAGYLVNRLRMHLVDVDEREWRNYKITASGDDVSYTTIIDRTSSGEDYKGMQEIEFSPATYRYFKVYGSGSTNDVNFHVKEFEVFQCVPAKRFTLNCAITSQQPALDVLEEMLSGFGGYFTFKEGLLCLDCDRVIASTGDMIDDSNIEEDTFSAQQVSKSEIPNRVILHWINPWNEWDWDDVQDDDEPDQAENDLRPPLEIDMPFITRESHARRMVRQIANEARIPQWRFSWTAGMTMAGMQPGDVRTLNKYPFIGIEVRITSVEENPETGKRQIEAVEYISSIYGDQTAGYTSPLSAKKYEDIRDPLRAAPMAVTGLSLAEDKDQHADGSWLPKIVVTFTKPKDAWWHHVDVELSTNGGSTYIVIGQAKDTGFEIKNLTAGVEYYVRLLSVSKYGVKANATTISPISSITLAGKLVPPGNVSGFNYALKPGSIEIYWNTATDANNDLSHYEIRDGGSWAAGTAIFKDLRTTKISFKPTKRSYSLYIKAFDRSGLESAAATNLPISITAPQVAGTPTVTAMPDGTLLVVWNNVNNEQVIRYDVHLSTSSGFTPSASTLKAQSAPSRTGEGAARIKVTAGTLYYVKVCAIDYLSDSIPDLYSYPSGQGSGTGRLITEPDITAGAVTTEKLYAGGIEVGGGTLRAAYIRLTDAIAGVVGYWGKFTHNTIERYGLWVRDFIAVGDTEANPELIFIKGTGLRILRSVFIGNSGTTDTILSTGEGGANLLANGGFEQCKSVGEWGGDANFIPGFTSAIASSGTPDGSVGIRDAATVGAGYAFGGKYLAVLTCTTTSRGWLQNYYTKVQTGKSYVFSWYGRQTASISIGYGIDWYNKDRAYISSSNTTATFNNASMTRTSKIASAPANACYARPYVLPGNASSGTIYVYTDSWQLEVGNVATAYKDSPIQSAHSALGFVDNPEVGREIYASGALILRDGNIGGLSDGLGGTIPANTLGRWSKGGAYFLDAAGDVIMSASGGIDGSYVIDETLALTQFETGLQAYIASPGETNPDAPHTDHLAILTPGSIELTATWPQSVAHGADNVPHVKWLFRFKDTGAGVYSRWYTGGETMVMYPESGAFANASGYSIFSGTEADDTYIYFYIRARQDDIVAGDVTLGFRDFTATYASLFYARKVSDGSIVNNWDEVEVEFEILRQGV